MTTKRATSRKIPGIRLRHEPSGAPWNRVALIPDSTSTSTTNATSVLTIRTEVASGGIWVACSISSSRAPKGSR